MKFKAVLPMIAVLAGCGLGPGDYVVYRVAFSETALSDSCYGDAGRPGDVVGDSSNVGTAQTFAIFVAPDGQLLLEAGGTVMSGLDTKDGYQFDGEVVDVEYFGYNDEDRITTTDTIAIAIARKGKSVSGTWEGRQTVVCTGDGCNPDGNTDCTQTVDFVGSEVDDVDLEHAI